MTAKVLNKPLQVVAATHQTSLLSSRLTMEVGLISPLFRAEVLNIKEIAQ
jgi:hypothetical protein